MAKKTAPTQAIVKWDEEMAKLAQIATATEAAVGGGNFIGTAQGRLKYQGAEVPNNEMNVVVIDHVLENQLYEGAYDPSNPQPPVCFAFGRTEEEMRPHEASSKPQGGPDGMCAGCPHNEWGSADVGRGKACKNIRRLALISEGDLENIDSAEIAYLKIPVMSVKGWAGYVRQLATNYSRPPLGALTQIKLIPDADSQFKVIASLVSLIEDAAQVGALIEKNKLVANEIMFPYAAPTAAPPQPVKKGRNVVPPRVAAAATRVQAPAAGKRAKF